jgi:hypothetical protein
MRSAGDGSSWGPITSSASAGAHELIRDHAARLVTAVADVLDSLERPSRGELDLVQTHERSINARTTLLGHRGDRVDRVPGPGIGEVEP